MKLGIKIKHEKKIMWCEFEEKCTYKLFFPIFHCFEDVCIILTKVTYPVQVGKHMAMILGFLSML